MFMIRQLGNFGRPASPQRETPINGARVGNGNSNSWNITDSFIEKHTTFKFNGAIGANGEHAKNKWTSPRYQYGPQFPPSA